MVQMRCADCWRTSWIGCASCGASPSEPSVFGPTFQESGRRTACARRTFPLASRVPSSRSDRGRRRSWSRRLGHRSRRRRASAAPPRAAWRSPPSAPRWPPGAACTRAPSRPGSRSRRRGDRRPPRPPSSSPPWPTGTPSAPRRTPLSSARAVSPAVSVTLLARARHRDLPLVHADQRHRADRRPHDARLHISSVHGVLRRVDSHPKARPQHRHVARGRVHVERGARLDAVEDVPRGLHHLVAVPRHARAALEDGDRPPPIGTCIRSAAIASPWSGARPGQPIASTTDAASASPLRPRRRAAPAPDDAATASRARRPPRGPVRRRSAP